MALILALELNIISVQANENGGASHTASAWKLDIYVPFHGPSPARPMLDHIYIPTPSITSSLPDNVQCKHQIVPFCILLDISD